jgi:hypothetical protein
VADNTSAGWRRHCVLCLRHAPSRSNC